MKMVEIKCPSCGGKLKVEDSQTKLITCEYCGSQFLLDDEKVQHITNYTIYQTTPSGKDQGNGAKIALGAGLACAGVLLAAFILSSGSGSSSGPRTAPPSIPAYTRPAGTKTFKELVAGAGLDSPFGEEAMKTIAEAAGKWLEAYDLTGID